MIKRILSLLLAFQMVLSMLPTPTYAEGNTDPSTPPTEPIIATTEAPAAVTDAPVETTVAPTESATEPSTAETVPATTESAEVTLCPSCGNEVCTCEPVTETTVPEETCEETTADEETEDQEDCTVPAEVTICPICGLADCTSEHLNWCTDCMVDDCGEEHIVGTALDDPAAAGTDCNCPLTDGVHYATCPNYVCPDCGTAEWHEICPVSYNVGKYAQLNSDAAGYKIWVSNGSDFNNPLDYEYHEFDEELIMIVRDWYWESGTAGLWYQVDACYKNFPESTEDFTWPDTAWILQNYTDDSNGVPDTLMFVTPDLCSVCGQPNCNVEHVQCDICGDYDCLALHFYCEICSDYDCGVTHLYCHECKSYTCAKTHVWCGLCSKYDCGITHESIAPGTAPVIPENPTLTPDVDVSVVDADGNPIPDSGLTLPAGTKASLSAWTDLEGALSYQWQICYDSINGRWADIQGQTNQGILVSPAMFLSISETEVFIRCVVTNGETTQASVEIPVIMEPQTESAVSARISGAAAAADADTGDDLQKAYVIVNYVYSDGRIAAATDSAQIIPGAAYSHAYTLPTVPGYKATLNTHSYGNRVSISGSELIMNFEEGALTQASTVFTVEYQPDFVSYTVIHYQQNLLNDGYTEFARETISNTRKTGERITDVHRSYEGFYHLLYETPTAAANGSTVIEVYYDRYYYLMKFDLSGGYGANPIYARYGASITVDTPTRAGYTFQGWKLDDVTQNPPATMPAENRTYTAIWQAGSSANVNVVIWGENADDEGYSYIADESHTVQAVPGATISWDSLKYDCGQTAHSHDDGCYSCNKTTHSHSNVCYTCGIVDHNHTTVCYTAEHIGNVYKGNRLKNAPKTPAEGQIYSYSNAFRYIYIDGSWYRYTGSVTNGNIAPTVCGKTEAVHTHNNNCLGCGQEPHNHTQNNCSLICGKSAHTHTSRCETGTEVMDTNLWTYVKSDEVIVAADGSTVLNVYFDRVEFTLTFQVGSTTIHSFSAKWGSNISEKWKFTGSNGVSYPQTNPATSWDPQNSDTYTQRITMLMLMPDENITFKHTTSSNTSRTFYYYVESLPGEAGDKVYSGTNYDRYYTLPHDFNQTYYNDDFFLLTGFTRYRITTQSSSTGSETVKNASPGSSWSSASITNFYYSRNSYSLVFNDGYNDVRTESVKFEAPLNAYTNYVPTLPSAYESGSRKFAGWYLNPECSDEEFKLSKEIMGSEDLKLYAKWEPVPHTVEFFFSRDSLERNEDIPAEIARLVAESGTTPATDPYSIVFAPQTVLHGTYIGNPGDPEVSEGYENIHPHTGLEFIGWFYLDDGVEMAFDPVNMPVQQNLQLYAKWNSNVLCYYNVHFVLDENADEQPDTDDSGNIIYIADSISGSGIAGKTYTYSAKGGTDLFTGYQQGYFPTYASQSLTLNAGDPEGTGANTIYFYYKQKDAVPYTVKYIDRATGKSLLDDKIVNDNTYVVVTENFQPVTSYMPDAYQKTLVVTDGATNEIIFYYTPDTEHALYVVNFYVQNLDSDLNHAGWTQYTSLQRTGDIGTEYTEDAMVIDGFTLSATYTDEYNVEYKVNGINGTVLPAAVGSLTADGKLTGTLTENGMELNFYYTRNLYPYEFRFMLNGTTTVLADPEFGKAAYGTTVTMAAKTIVMDLDGDGVNEDYQLYDSADATKDIQIKTDGNPLESDATVGEGQATTNVATFYYVRCTQTMRITKVLQNVPDPDPDQEFSFTLTIHATSGYHKQSYTYEKGETTGTLSYSHLNKNVLAFTLKAGETITIHDLPTAQYTVEEINIPANYSVSYAPGKTNKLTKESVLDVTVTNSSRFGTLTINKTATGATAADTFIFHIKGTDENTQHIDMDVAITGNGSITIHNLPLGNYSVTEDTDWSWRYSNTGITGDSTPTLTAAAPDATVTFANKFITNKWLNGLACLFNTFSGNNNQQEGS